MFVLRLGEVYLYKLYYDPKKRYPSSHFGIFIDLVEHIHDQLCLCRWMEPTTQIEYIVFFLEVNFIICYISPTQPHWKWAL
jgi:hypothetical protein